MARGTPLTFRCGKCKAWRDLPFTLTGRNREDRSGRANHIDGLVHEYRCRRCGHTGWSKHPDIALMAKHGWAATRVAQRRGQR